MRAATVATVLVVFLGLADTAFGDPMKYDDAFAPLRVMVPQ